MKESLTTPPNTRPEVLPETSDTTLVFPSESSVKTPCSYNECTSGHRWPPSLAVAKCTGCETPILAVQKTQCPYCNEPTTRTVLRSDFVPRGAGVAKRCQGHDVQGESLDLEMFRHEWQEIQAETELFEDRRVAERVSS